MSLLELNEKISEHLDAIEAKPIPLTIRSHLNKIKEYFEQYVETSELGSHPTTSDRTTHLESTSKEYCQHCDELSEANERQERTIEELRKAEERLTSELESKEETIADLEEKCAIYSKVTLKYFKDKAQLAKQCEEYRQRCDELSAAKEHHEGTIEEKKNGKRLTYHLAPKRSVTKELRRFGKKLTSELASQKQIIVQLERKCTEINEVLHLPPDVFISEAEIRVENLPRDVTEADLFYKFRRIGPLSSIRVFRGTLLYQPYIICADVEFQHPADAERAIDTLNWDDMDGSRICIAWSPNSAQGKLNNQTHHQDSARTFQ
uniref:RRM domain-containing protein n=1 Tax=Steinernema glaseri TaxID=37863 RepID=A0A1I7Z6E7_9BILA